MKLILSNKEEVNIEPGASLSRISSVIGNYAELDSLEKNLTRENLKEVKFVEEDVTVSTFADMCTTDPLFTITKKDGNTVVTFGIRKLTENELQENDVKTAISYLNDEQALTVKDLFEEWNPEGIAYSVGDRVKYNEKLYKCLQAHTSQSTWDPIVAPSLWVEILPGQEGTEPGEWKQPESTNPYKKGDKVTHNGKTWESLVDGNVWEPGAQGSEALWKDVTE